MQVAIAKRALDLIGLDLDAAKLAELAVYADKIKAGDTPESTMQSEEVQTLLSQVVTPKDAPEVTTCQSARCPHCGKSFVIDTERVR